MSQDEGKRRSGDKAAEYVTDGSIVGVGTGSTVAFFIAALGRMKHRIEGAVSSSERSTALLKALGIPVLELNNTGTLALYVDGADECDPAGYLIKGGGAALVRLGGQPVWRDGVVTDNGNWILDVHNWQVTDPVGLEREVNQLPGVVSVGLFARRAADVVVVDGVVRPG